MKRTLLKQFPAVAVTQPIGTFYVTSMQSELISLIAKADVRRLEKSTTAVEQYLGIQRRLDPKRRKEIANYVWEVDATFPTSIVIAVEDERSIDFDEDTSVLSFFSVFADEDGPAINDDEIATILDGQHRLAGLQAAEKSFGLPVTVFPAIDIAEQAYIFATVNLAKTKVNSSLAYDLLSYARSRSPERTCHDVAVALNDAPGSPFQDRIKRLGSKTPGVTGETLSQATFVRALLPYVSREPRRDREDLRNGILLPLIKTAAELKLTPLRNLFIEEKDEIIADVLWEYFDSIKSHWGEAWRNDDPGQIIKRTNGFRAFMNVFGQAYSAVGGNPRRFPLSADYQKIWQQSTISAADFNREVYLPGATGERDLTKSLESAVRVFATKTRAIG